MELTNEQIEEGRRLRSEGWPYSRIAKHLGLSFSAVYKYTRAPIPIPSRFDLVKAGELASGGMSWPKVAKAIGISRRYIYRLLEDGKIGGPRPKVYRKRGQS